MIQSNIRLEKRDNVGPLYDPYLLSSLNYERFEELLQRYIDPSMSIKIKWIPQALWKKGVIGGAPQIPFRLTDIIDTNGSIRNLGILSFLNKLKALKIPGDYQGLLIRIGLNHGNYI